MKKVIATVILASTLALGACAGSGNYDLEAPYGQERTASGPIEAAPVKRVKTTAPARVQRTFTRAQVK